MIPHYIKSSWDTNPYNNLRRPAIPTTHYKPAEFHLTEPLKTGLDEMDYRREEAKKVAPVKPHEKVVETYFENREDTGEGFNIFLAEARSAQVDLGENIRAFAQELSRDLYNSAVEVLDESTDLTIHDKVKVSRIISDAICLAAGTAVELHQHATDLGLVTSNDLASETWTVKGFEDTAALVDTHLDSLWADINT